jgi:formylglycine-generating enzyme required for sulfatase activity
VVAGLEVCGFAWAQTAESVAADSDAMTNSVGMEFKLIQPGKFMMGGEEAQPVHEVTITKPFYIGVREVTRLQYATVMGDDLADVKGPQRPKERASWTNAQEFCLNLSQKENVKYRLPTEAEWEYACRAGTTTEFYWGDDFDGGYAWVVRNSGGTARDVGTRRPNPWGLFDMIGNAGEWCEDWYAEAYAGNDAQVDPKGPAAGKYRVLRGGSWNDAQEDCRATSRDYRNPDSRNGNLGFRVVRTP